MARNVLVGVIISGKDATAAAFRSAGKAVSMLSSTGQGAMRTLGHATIALNQGVALARRGYALLDSTIGDAIRTSLAYRGANDGAAKDLKEFAKSGELLRARLGDALLPVVQGLAQAFNHTGDSVRLWIEQNRKLIGMKVAEWAGRIGRVLIDSIAGGVLLVARAWAGWSMIIDAVKGGLNAFFSLALDGISRVLGGAANMADALHMTGTAEALRTASTTVAGLGEEFGRSADEASSSIGKTVADLDKLEGKIEGVRDKAQAALSEGIVRAQKNVQTSTQGGTRTVEEQTKAFEKLRAAAVRGFEIQGKAAENYYSRLADMQESEFKKFEADQQKRYEMLTSGADSAATTAVSAFSQAYDKMEQDHVSYYEALKSVLAGLGRQVAEQAAAFVIAEGIKQAAAKLTGAVQTETAIEANAAEAAARTTSTAAAVAAGETKLAVDTSTAASGAIAAHSTIPFVGIAIGIAAAIALIAAILKFKKFSRGGLVTGGVPGRDSVPALLKPGEVVKTEWQARDEARGGGGRGVNITINPRWDHVAPPDQASTERLIVRTMKRELETLVRNGQLDLQRAW